MRVDTSLLVLFVALASGPHAPDARAADNVPKKVKEDFGEQAIAVLSGATKVEVFRLDKKILGKAGADTIGADMFQFAITATGKEKDGKFAAKVRAFLFDEATRTPSGAGGFRGDVAFRLTKEKESVTVIVDFEGSQFMVVPRDGEGMQTSIIYGGFLFDKKGNFDKGGLFARVKALAVEAFPDDAAIKALKR